MCVDGRIGSILFVQPMYGQLYSYPLDWSDWRLAYFVEPGGVKTGYCSTYTGSVHHRCPETVFSSHIPGQHIPDRLAPSSVLEYS